MIKVDFDKYGSTYRIDMKGHALWGSIGNDIVCAASSILCYTLAENLQRLEKEGDICNLVCDIREGDAHFEFEPGGYDSDNSDTAETVVFALLTGFSLLESQFPNNITANV